MTRKTLTALASFGALASLAMTAIASPAAAQDTRFAADLGIGTTGIAGNLQVGLADWVAVRGGYNFLQFDLDDQDYDDITYSSELDFSTFGGFVDLHPFSNAFTVTGGAYLGEKEVAFDATPTSNVEIGDQTFTPEQVGMLIGSATLEDTAGYVGLGYDNALYGSGRWSFFARGGIMFAGSPQIDLTAEGGDFSDDPNFQAELQEEEDNIQGDLDDYDMFPVVSLGVAFKL